MNQTNKTRLAFLVPAILSLVSAVGIFLGGSSGVTSAEIFAGILFGLGIVFIVILITLEQARKKSSIVSAFANRLRAEGKMVLETIQELTLARFILIYDLNDKTLSIYRLEKNKIVSVTKDLPRGAYELAKANIALTAVDEVLGFELILRDGVKIRLFSSNAKLKVNENAEDQNQKQINDFLAAAG